MICWHFAGKTLRDGRPLPRKGDTLKHEGAVVPCKSGYHGSVQAIDALTYAPGAMVARVELGGTVTAHGTPVDKYAASERTNLTDYVDATRVLHEFACWCATQALDRAEAAGRKVDPRIRAAIATKLAWLDDKATDAELDSAWDSAMDAATYAARYAALYAAMDAAWDSAWDAATYAARYAAAMAAAMAAARDAARAAAARYAAWDAQNTELERRLLALLEAPR